MRQRDPPFGWVPLSHAERVRFELTVPLRVQRFSRPSYSTTLAPLRSCCRSNRATNITDGPSEQCPRNRENPYGRNACPVIRHEPKRSLDAEVPMPVDDV